MGFAIYTFLAAAAALVFVVPALLDAKRHAAYVGQTPCRRCGHPLGPKGAATRKQMPYIGYTAWLVKCSTCGKATTVHQKHDSSWI